MPHAAILTSYPFPGFAATSNRVLSLAKGLASDKYFKVTVIGPGSDRIIEENKVDNEPFFILSTNNKQYTGNNLFLRALYEFKLFFSLIKFSKRCCPDIIIVTIPSIFLLGIIFFNKRKIPIIVDVRDLVWEYFLKKPFFYKFVGIIMKNICINLLRRVDKVTLTNKAEYNNLIKYLNSPYIICNGLDKNRFNLLKSLLNYRYNTKIKNINITYSGNVGLAQRLGTLIDAVKNINNINVTIIGDGKEYIRLNAFIKDNRINNVIMTGAIDFSSIIKHYQLTDIFFVQIGKEFKTALPSKIFEYLATGKGLILSAPIGPATDLGSIFDGVHIIEPENLIMLREKIISLVPSKNITYPNNIKIIKEQYLRENQASLFSNIVMDAYQN